MPYLGNDDNDDLAKDWIISIAKALKIPQSNTKAITGLRCQSSAGIKPMSTALDGSNSSQILYQYFSLSLHQEQPHNIGIQWPAANLESWNPLYKPFMLS